MRKVKVGVVGFGNMGSSHVRYVIDEGKVPNIEIAAICDIDPAKLEKSKKLYPDIPVFDKAEDMYKSGLCEAVIVATPHYDHPSLSISAFENGLHVMCEKPAGVYTKQVLEMNEAAKKSGKVFTIMFCMRVDPVFKALKKLVDSGELGHIKRITWQMTSWYRPQRYHDSASWRSTWATEGGGTLINQNPHQLDLWQWLFGMPDQVWADVSFGKYFDIEVDDDVTAMMKYNNGTTGVYLTSTGETPGSNRLDISCDMGRVVVLAEEDKITFDKLDINERKWNADYNDDEPPRKTIDVPIIGERIWHAEILNEFADAILEGKPQTAEGFEGIKELTMSNAMYLSSWKGGQWIDLNDFPHDEFYKLLMERVAISKVKEFKSSEDYKTL